jgi:hypothetical protein
MNYNKAIFGDAKTTPDETVKRLQEQGCFSNGKLMIYPAWFGAAEMFDAVNAGLLVQKHYRNCYNHTDLMLA